MFCMKVAEPILLSHEERTKLDAWASARSISFRIVQRAKIIRMAANGVLNQDIAQKLSTSCCESKSCECEK